MERGCAVLVRPKFGVEERPVPEGDDGGTIGERVKWVRDQLGWSQQELADQARISLSNLAQLEQGRIGRPQRATTRQIAEAARLSHEWLRYGWGEPWAREAVPERVPFRVYIAGDDELSEADQEILIALRERLIGRRDDAAPEQGEG